MEKKVNLNLNFNIGLGAVILILIVVAVIFFTQSKKGNGFGSNLPISSGSSKYDTFAKCLKDKGAVFYGAFWCSHCQNQKKAFGASVEFLPYVECSTLDGKGQLQACTDKGVQGYPTWVFPDGSRQSGEVPFETLASKTGCVLPK